MNVNVQYKEVNETVVTNTCVYQVVILVANKADLVRNREIRSSAGKHLATKYGVKYIETSPGTWH